MILTQRKIFQPHYAYNIYIEQIKGRYYLKAIIKHSYVKKDVIRELGFASQKPMKVNKYTKVNISSSRFIKRTLRELKIICKYLGEGASFSQALHERTIDQNNLKRKEELHNLWLDFNKLFETNYQYSWISEPLRKDIVRAIHDYRDELLTHQEIATKLQEELDVRIGYNKIRSICSIIDDFLGEI